MPSLAKQWLRASAENALLLGRRSVALTITPESEVLPAVNELFSMHDGAKVSVNSLTHVVQPEFYGKELIDAWIKGRTAGFPLPDWALGNDGVLRGGVQVSRVSNVWYAPRLGALISEEGRIFRSTVAEALYFTPTLGALPRVQLRKTKPPRFYPPRRSKSLSKATVFVSWGGLHNYGHFLLDCLPALWTAATQGAIPTYPAIAPELHHWQKDLITHLNGTADQVTSLSDDIVHIEDAVFSSCMDHFLHTPNHPLNLVRDTILSNVPVLDANAPKRVYLTRGDAGKRVMLNEAALESALRSRGFTVLNPSSLPIAHQVSIFQNADVVISATGAGLANSLFAAKTTKIFELFPSNFPGVWVRNLCFLLGLDWYGFISPAPVEERHIVIEGEPRPGTEFSWMLMIPEFLDFLDLHL